MVRFLVCILVHVILLTSISFSEDVVITMQGTLDTILATDENGISDSEGYQAILPFRPGATVMATYRYNLDVEDVNGSDAFGRYFTGGEASLVVDGTTFEFPSFIDLGNDTPNDFFWARLLLDDIGQLYNADGWQYDAAGSTQFVHRVELTDSSGTVFETDELPSNPFDETDFDSLTWRISTIGQTGPETITTPLGSHSGRMHQIAGTITSVNFIVVPEPATTSIILMPLLFCTIRIRRK